MKKSEGLHGLAKTGIFQDAIINARVMVMDEMDTMPLKTSVAYHAIKDGMLPTVEFRAEPTAEEQEVIDFMQRMNALDAEMAELKELNLFDASTYNKAVDALVEDMLPDNLTFQDISEDFESSDGAWRYE